MQRSRWVSFSAVAVAVCLGACNTSPAGPNGGTPTSAQIFVLNQLSRTIQQFNIDGQALVPFGSPFVLPANFDGSSFDLTENLIVTTSSAAGGSQIVWIDVATSEQLISTFPGPDGALADPGRATLVPQVGAPTGTILSARAENAIYVAFPGQQAQLVAEGTGEYVQRVVPFGQFLVTIDSNVDDAGGTFDHLGGPRVELFRFLEGTLFDDVEVVGSLGATDAIILDDDLVMLSGGSLAAGQPVGDGSVVVVSLTDRGVQDNEALNGNGLSIEPGRDGLAHIARTKGPGTFETDIVTFSFSTKSFVNGPQNPITPRDADGSAITNCRVASALIDGRRLCVTWVEAAQGRLVLMQSDGTFLDDTPVGAGASDIFIR